MDLKPIHFVIAPDRFPKNLSYVLVEDEAFVPDTLSFLRAFAPLAPYHGTVPVTTPVHKVWRKAVLVVSSDSWYDAVARLLESGFAADRIYVLLNTYNDGAGYLEVGRTCPEHMAELADPSVPIENKIRWMRRHLLGSSAVSRFEGDRPIWCPEHYFHPFHDRVRANAATIHDITARLGDRESREAYNTVLYGSPVDLLEYFLSRVFREQQYAELIRLRPGDVIVNAGIASGWDIPYLVAANRGQGRHILVDPIQLHIPGSPYEGLKGRCGLEFVECGLWDQTDELTFPVDISGMVHSDQPGGTLPGGRVHRSKLRRLDDLVNEWDLDRLNLIKMDIEGADLRALHGMRETLTRFRPQLAVCLYHDQEHMWVIPSLLMSWLPNYRFYVRHYSYTRFECLLYAIPEERLVESTEPTTIAGRFHRAGLDYGLIDRTWSQLVPHAPLEAMASQMNSPPEEATRAAETKLDQAFWTSNIGSAAPVVEIDVGKDVFLGTGWGDGCESDQGQTWRWIGPDGEASLYLTLDPNKDHLCRWYFHHVETQNGFDQATLEVNGTPGTDREIGSNGTYFYAQWRIPATAQADQGGRCRLRFRTEPGQRHTAIAMVHCWQAA